MVGYILWCEVYFQLLKEPVATPDNVGRNVGTLIHIKTIEVM